MKTINLYDINVDSCEVITDKSGRRYDLYLEPTVVGGANHGRKVLRDKDKNLYYKIFDKEYCHRINFVTGYEKEFFNEVAPALNSLIVDETHDIIGYVTEGGKPLALECECDFNNSGEHIHLLPIKQQDKIMQRLSDWCFDKIPVEFYQKILQAVKNTKIFFYDLVPMNIIELNDGRLSLIDLEGVYDLNEFYTMGKRNAEVKPNYYYEDLKKIAAKYLKK